ncbi:hypothetical protein N7501_009770 [Penicillium viridicatum]|nr:hypothetical protein N7501_009770 [Penicillium viridicatum]
MTQSHLVGDGSECHNSGASAGNHSCAPPVTTSLNLWCQAYVRCYEEKGEDAKRLDDLKEILGLQAPPKEDVEVSSDNRIREFEALSAALGSDLRERIKKLEHHKWKIPLLRKEVDFSDVVETCVDVVVLVKDFVSTALTGNLYASLGWSAVCIGIQFLENPIKGQRDFLDAFNVISEIMNRFAVVETLPQASESKSTLREGAIKLYRLVLTFQAEALKYLTRHTIHRVWKNTVDPNHWAQSLQGIKDQENICNEILTRESSVAVVAQSKDLSKIRKELRRSVGNQLAAYKSLQSQLSYAIDEQTFGNLLKHCADGAVYSSDKPQCLADTRSEILSHIISWIASDDIGNERIYWMSGMAGMGKSTIAGTISEYCLAQGYIVVSFFFSRESSSRDKTDRLVPTIVRQLMDSSEVLKHYVCSALREYHGHFDRPADEQWKSLIQEPLEALQRTTKGALAPPTVLVVIDALDECAEDVIKHVISILDSLEEISSIRFKALLTSRRTERILNQMRGLRSAKREYDLYRDVDSNEINLDIRRYYEHRLVEIKMEYFKNQDLWDFDENESKELQNWPTEELVSLLVEKTDGLFQYAKVACNIIQGNDSRESPAIRIQHILDGSVSGDLDDLYSKALMLSVPHGVGTTDHDIEQFFAHFQLIIGSIIFLLEPLTGSGIARLLGKENGINQRAIRSFTGRLRSVLSVPDSPDETIKTIHLSLRELLGDEKRCEEGKIPRFHIKEGVIHDLIFRCCTKVLASLIPAKKRIDRTMIRIFLEENYENGGLPAECRYASIFWTDHCRMSAAKSQALSLGSDFVVRHGNSWICLLIFLKEAHQEIRSAVVFEDMVDDIKQSVECDFSAQHMHALETTSRSLFEGLS